MNSDQRPRVSESDGFDFSPRRVFLYEPGWTIGMKVGSQREFCYMMAPGQDFYHRFYDGELFLQRGDERLCLACAERRGLLSYTPRGLREPKPDWELEFDAQAESIDLKTSSEPID